MPKAPSPLPWPLEWLWGQPWGGVVRGGGGHPPAVTHFLDILGPGPLTPTSLGACERWLGQSAGLAPGKLDPCPHLPCCPPGVGGPGEWVEGLGLYHSVSSSTLSYRPPLPAEAPPTARSCAPPSSCPFPLHCSPEGILPSSRSPLHHSAKTTNV